MARCAYLADKDITWRLLYTKPRAESWVDANLRLQGFESLLPRTPARSGLAPLFPRYVFAGCHHEHRVQSLGGTFGVQYVVRCGVLPAIVPRIVIEAICNRMDAHGVVHLEQVSAIDPIFATQRSERLAALEKFAAAGFKVRTA